MTKLNGVFTKRWSEMNGYQKRLFVVLMYGLIASLSALYLMMTDPNGFDPRTSDKTWLYLFGSAVLVLNIQDIIERYIVKDISIK